MGQFSEGKFSGFICSKCSGPIDGDEPGYPRECKKCNPQEQTEESFMELLTKLLTGR